MCCSHCIRNDNKVDINTINTKDFGANNANKILKNLGYDIIKKEKGNYKTSSFKIPYSSELIKSKNLIFRGAPGTGKSYIAKQIAADIG